MKHRALLILSLVLLMSPMVVMAEDVQLWPQWRGPGRDCQIAAVDWPETLSGTSLTQTFRVPLGESYSGPIVSDQHVFVTEAVGKTEKVRALDRFSGNEIWQVEWPASMTVPFFAASNGSWIRSTPAWAQGRLFVASMEDILVCLDAADGREIWRHDFRSTFNTSNQSFGFVCSPLVVDGAVYVQTGAGLVKLSAETGTVIWRSLVEDGGMMGGAFSSPIMATIRNTPQLVVQTRSRLVGVGPETGDELWSVNVPAFRGMNILTPTVIGNRVFTSSYGGGSFMFEVSEADGSLTVSELWKAKNEGYMSSPVVVDGAICLHLRNQRFVCLDSDTGDVLWTTKPFGKYWSMVANGNRVLVLDERGDLLLLDLSRQKFTQLDARHVSDTGTWAHVAIAGNQLFVRELNGLLAFRWSGLMPSGAAN
ncbi:MAG: PQQ-like beta-propeller repeat protein [Fuerstiella sp.]